MVWPKREIEYSEGEIAMKYCSNCGTQLSDNAAFCSGCGSRIEQPAYQANYQPNYQPAYVAQTPKKDDTMSIVVKVFLILGCVAQGWAILPLAWCLPITITIFNRLRDNQPISTGLKICTLLFVNLIAGICLLCMNDD